MDKDNAALAFSVKELSEIFAIKTLYRYLDKDMPDRIKYFTGAVYEPRLKSALTDVPTLDCIEGTEIGCFLGIHSDISKKVYFSKSMLIDVSILKHCAEDTDSKKILELKKKYHIKEASPIMTIGFSSGISEEIEIIKKFHNKTQIYLVGNTTPEEMNISLPEEIVSQLQFVNEYGVLKDYFAMSDIALYSDNLKRTHGQMRNFVEATAGGPLFIIPPSNIRQYGFKKFSRYGLVKNFSNLGQLSEGIEEHLQNSPCQDQARESRNRHLQDSRTKFLPAITYAINQHLEDKVKSPKDLKELEELGIQTTIRGDQIILDHKDTDWDYSPDSRTYYSINNLDEFHQEIPFEQSITKPYP